MKFQAVIFDMDGLLVDSEPVWASCEAGMLERRGKVFDMAIQAGLIGMRMQDYLSGVIRAYGLNETVEVLKDEVVGELISRIADEVRPKPGAPELLRWLKDRGVPCSIASSSPLAVIDAVVTTAGWDAYLGAHTSGEEVPNGKPHPDVYLEAARRLGVSAADCLALEDSPNGARAAVAAGMTTFAVPDAAHTSHAAFDTITPHVFHSLHAVLDYLRAGSD